MRNKSLFLLLAGVCGTIAAVGVGQWMQNAQGTASIDMVEILVTTQAINAEEEITAEKLRLEKWPADRVPAGASLELAQFEGRFAKVPLFEGEPMLDMKLMDEVEDMVVPKGYTVVSLPAGRDGTVNLVRPGDRVDIRGFFAEGVFPRDTVLGVLTGVKVYAIDGVTKFDPEEKRSRTARDIQLLIRKADNQAFDFAKKYGEISLSLGSPTADDDSIPIDQPSAAAEKFVQDLDKYRAEQDRLKKEAEAAKVSEPTEDEEYAGPQEDTFLFRTTKMHNGRIIVYEWHKGESIPRIVADTGALDLGDRDVDTTDVTASGGTSTGGGDDENFPQGGDSPFFDPPGSIDE
ncbi:MAG: Flp pilus assembly protein CpaB [Planctomycetota bacterium]